MNSNTKRNRALKLVLFLMIVCSQLCIAQEVTIIPYKRSEVYVCCHNYFTVLAPNTRKSEIEITTNNGIVDFQRGTKDTVFITWTPEKTGYSSINISEKTKDSKRSIKRQTFKVLPALQPQCMLLGKSKGSFSKFGQSIDYAIGPLAPTHSIMGMGCGKYPIIKFELYIIRRDEVIFSREFRASQGCKFDKETIEFLKTLQACDKVWLTNFWFRAWCHFLVGDMDLQFDIVDDEVQSN